MVPFLGGSSDWSPEHLPHGRTQEGDHHLTSTNSGTRLRSEVADHRYYDPATGQFLSVDPDLPETGQPYAYAAADPVNEVDPSGASATKCSPGDFFCLNVNGHRTNVTSVSATISFPAIPNSAELFLGFQIVVDACSPSNSLLGASYWVLGPNDVVGNPESFTLKSDDIPAAGVNFPNGTVISAYLINPDGEAVEVQSATVKQNPFLWGIFS